MFEGEPSINFNLALIHVILFYFYFSQILQ